MSEKMRIGELLLLREKIDPWLLSHTLKEQAATGQRLISLLVSRAQLDPDDGALMLSEQLGYPAALQRHLERRDAAVLDLLPRPLGARWAVLPLGRARTGAIVVVARDPTPILTAALEHAMRGPVVLAVTPSIQLDRLVQAVYGPPTAPEQDVPEAPPTLSDIGNVHIEPDSDSPKRARTVSFMFKEMPELAAHLAQAGLTPPPATIDDVLHEVDRAHTAAAVERLVMAYAARRWQAALLARIDGDRAVGARGHGPSLGTVEDVAIALAVPSSISLAREQRRVIAEEPSSDTQEQLRRVLGTAIFAAPVIASGQVIAVLAVGEPLDTGAGNPLAELDRLVDALGAAHTRFSR